jgi:hypothetical protein
MNEGLTCQVMTSFAPQISKHNNKYQHIQLISLISYLLNKFNTIYINITSHNSSL